MPTNKERAELGAWILVQYNKDADDVSQAELLTDVLTNLMHFCDDIGTVSFDDCLRMASMHHEAEVEEEVAPGLAAIASVAIPDDDPRYTGKSAIIRMVAEEQGIPVIDMPLAVPKYRCGNCDLDYFTIDDMAEIRDLTQRVEPGGTMPAGECHECSGLCYLIDPPKPKLWTIAVTPFAGDDPMVDLVYCDHRPTAKEIAQVHPHLKDFAEDDNVSGWVVEEYTVNDSTPIPTIP